MNIFVLDNDPMVAASFLDDYRLNKMITETAQIFRAALGANGFTDDMCLEHGVLTKSGTTWKITHKNHPVVLWAGECKENLEWLYRYALGLHNEYLERYGRQHASIPPILKMGEFMDMLPSLGCKTWFRQCMPDEYKHNDVVYAYRRYYKSKQNSKRGVLYRKGDVPYWWEMVE